eukprot:scaffold185292_cov49-Prasinocladus_malaysianus.AAC.1
MHCDLAGGTGSASGHAILAARSPPPRASSAQAVTSLKHPKPAKLPSASSSPNHPTKVKPAARAKQLRNSPEQQSVQKPKTPPLPAMAKVGNGKGSAGQTPPSSAGKRSKPVRRRLWAKNKGSKGFPDVEIYTPKLPVWKDTVDEGSEDWQGTEDDDCAVRAEVQNGLTEIRDFNDQLKRIWDQRQGRELLQARPLAFCCLLVM